MRILAHTDLKNTKDFRVLDLWFITLLRDVMLNIHWAFNVNIRFLLNQYLLVLLSKQSDIKLSVMLCNLNNKVCVNE